MAADADLVVSTGRAAPPPPLAGGRTGKPSSPPSPQLPAAGSWGRVAAESAGSRPDLAVGTGVLMTERAGGAGDAALVTARANQRTALLHALNDDTCTSLAEVHRALANVGTLMAPHTASASPEPPSSQPMLVHGGFVRARAQPAPDSRSVLDRVQRQQTLDGAQALVTGGALSADSARVHAVRDAAHAQAMFQSAGHVPLPAMDTSLPQPGTQPAAAAPPVLNVAAAPVLSWRQRVAAAAVGAAPA